MEAAPQASSSRENAVERSLDQWCGVRVRPTSLAPSSRGSARAQLGPLRMRSRFSLPRPSAVHPFHPRGGLSLSERPRALMRAGGTALPVT